MNESSEKARLKAVKEQIKGVEARLSDPKSADMYVIETEFHMYECVKSMLERTVFG